MDPIERWVGGHPTRFIVGYMACVVVGLGAVALQVGRDSRPFWDQYGLGVALAIVLFVVAVVTVLNCRVKTRRAVAGWYRDVRGLHRLRYWSGDSWTEWVADGDDGFRESLYS